MADADASRLGLGAYPISIAEWLGSDAPPQSHFIRVGDTFSRCGYFELCG